MAVVVDSHTHLLPGRLAERVRQHFGASARQLVYPLAHEIVRKQLAAEGVDEIWTLPYAHKPGVAEWLNQSTLEAASEPGPLSVIGGATVHPEDDDPVAIVRRAIEELGLRVLKLHCSVGTFDADDRRLDDVWEFVSERRVPVVVHAGHATSGQTTADELRPIRAIAERFPAAQVVIAHCGFPAVDAALDLVESHSGVHVDLTPVVRSRPAIPFDRLQRNAEKVLFGSDAPNVALPAGDHLRDLRSMGLEPAALAAVTGGNARRLLGPQAGAEHGH